MCMPCALRQKIGFIKKTEELVKIFGLVVSGHWVMWRDGEGPGLELWVGVGGGSQRWRREDTTPTQGHITHADASLSVLRFQPLCSFAARTDCLLADGSGGDVVARDSRGGRAGEREGTTRGGYSVFARINQCVRLFMLITRGDSVHWFTRKHNESEQLERSWLRKRGTLEVGGVCVVGLAGAVRSRVLSSMRDDDGFITERNIRNTLRMLNYY